MHLRLFSKVFNTIYMIYIRKIIKYISILTFSVKSTEYVIIDLIRLKCNVEEVRLG